MKLDEARSVRINFGKYSGRTVGEIADGDLSYLDWLIDAHSLTDLQRRAVQRVLDDRASELDDATGDD